jgi:hypothetical protein
MIWSFSETIEAMMGRVQPIESLLVAVTAIPLLVRIGRRFVKTGALGSGLRGEK